LPGPVNVTVLLGVAVPEITGDSDVVVFLGLTILTVGGATAVKLVVAGTLLPPALLEIAVIVFGPALTVIVQE
jgi:hypothetical protein